MKRTFVITLFVLSVLALFPLLGAAGEKNAQSYIDEAVRLADSGEMPGTIALLEEARAAYPGNADILAYLGFYTGISAGNAADFVEASRLTMLSFDLLGEAVKIDPANPRGWLFRGIMGVKVPEFLGKLDGGIEDLEKAADIYSKSPSTDSMEGLVRALGILEEGYAKKGDTESRRRTLERIVAAAPGSDAAGRASQALAELPPPSAGTGDESTASASLQGDSSGTSLTGEPPADPQNAPVLFKQASSLFEAGSYAEAEKILKTYIVLEPRNVEAYKMLALAISAQAGTGYSEKIYEDTTYRSGQAFEVMKLYDKAIEIAPEDMELRLTRGILGITMPFFLGKHDQGKADLEMVAAAEASDEMKSQALYYLGAAHQREALRYWIKVASKYPESEAADLVYGQMRPEMERFDPSQHDKPFVLIDFVLGFQDELPPQTAVWIEDDSGAYVATVYVSGFAGYVKEKQVTLNSWAEASDFKGLDGITSASIDVGHHYFTWDLTDHTGRKVGKGTYRVMIETCFWPSMKYQLVSASIETGKKGGSSERVEAGDFIPMLELTYFPK